MACSSIKRAHAIDKAVMVDCRNCLLSYRPTSFQVGLSLHVSAGGAYIAETLAVSVESDYVVVDL
jgi:hypothetical protein